MPLHFCGILQKIVVWIYVRIEGKKEKSNKYAEQRLLKEISVQRRVGIKKKEKIYKSYRESSSKFSKNFMGI